jgi:hypothetical protein
MGTETAARGGFAGDPAEAFNPPGVGGCCGATPATSSCCGTAEAAEAAGTCCDPSAKAEAVASGAGCCG